MDECACASAGKGVLSRVPLVAEGVSGGAGVADTCNSLSMLDLSGMGKAGLTSRFCCFFFARRCSFLVGLCAFAAGAGSAVMPDMFAYLCVKAPRRQVDTNNV